MHQQKDTSKQYGVKLFRHGYCAIQGLSNASTLAFSVSDAFDTRPAWIIPIAILGFFSDYTSSYYFQGRALSKNLLGESSDKQPSASPDDLEAPSNLLEALLTSDENISTNKAGTEYEPCHCTTIAFQVVYTFFIDLPKVLGNRYFFFKSTQKLLEATFDKDLSLPFMIALPVSLLIKLLFLWSNETYDANAGIANKFEQRKTPFYHKPLQALASKMPNFFITLGSLEHSLINGILPMLVLTCMLPSNINPAWVSEKTMATTLLLSRFWPLSAAIAFFALLIHGYQTYFFEGGDTRENLKLPDNNHRKKQYCCNSTCGIYALKYSIQLFMPIFHGIETFDAIFFPLENFLEDNNDSVNYVYTLLTFSIASFVISTSVNYLTEAKAAADELNDHAKLLKEKRATRGLRESSHESSVTEMTHHTHEEYAAI